MLIVEITYEKEEGEKANEITTIKRDGDKL
jgi:hypothetical protein